MAIGINDYGGAGYRVTLDAGNERFGLHTASADPNHAAFTRQSGVADDNIVAAGGVVSGLLSDGNVAASAVEVVKRLKTVGDVLARRPASPACAVAHRGVEGSRGAVMQCVAANGEVLLPRRVCPQCLLADGHIVVSCGVLEHGLVSNGRVVTAFCFAVKRVDADAGVSGPDCVGGEGRKAHRRVEASGSVLPQRVETDRRIAGRQRIKQRVGADRDVGAAAAIRH